MSKVKHFSDPDFHIGDGAETTGKDVTLAQEYLERFGYLIPGSYTKGVYCNKTRKAGKKFQRSKGLKVDGIIGPVTKSSIMEPRCGLPDFSRESSNFSLRGSKYDQSHLTYAFENNPSSMDGHTARDIVRSAFVAWQEVCSLTFSEVHLMENPTFRISWETEAHGDGNDFDGVGHVLAHAFYPPPIGGAHAGKLHFDDDETYVEPGGNGISLYAVALHEIGHLLGLKHSDDSSAIMYATYGEDRTSLREDDIAGIQALYSTPQMRFIAEANGQMSVQGEEQHYSMNLSANAKITLDGPDDADFDLYVQRGKAPNQNEYIAKAVSISADESVFVAVDTPGIYHIMVFNYEGKGGYNLKIELV